MSDDALPKILVRRGAWLDCTVCGEGINADARQEFIDAWRDVHTKKHRAVLAARPVPASSPVQEPQP